MSSLQYREFYRRRLPHYQPPSATLFVTFRLANSLPRDVVDRLIEERKQFEALIARRGDLSEKEQARQLRSQERRWFSAWDEALDTNTSGPHWLRETRIAELVADSLHHLDGKSYTLIAFCVMPNHVHVVFTPKERSDGTYHSLTKILHSLKRHTARQANLILNRSGQFWQHESYDHVVRNDRSLRRIIDYVLNNPVKAGLVDEWEDWAWNYANEDFM